jgi:glutamine synthetase
VAKLPEIEKDNTDRNRTSPVAFTGNKFEFRAVGGSQSIAFPVMLAERGSGRGHRRHHGCSRRSSSSPSRSTMPCSRWCARSSSDTSACDSRGTTTRAAWVVEAKKRGLLNLRRGDILSKEELESRYHVRMERYVKDILIELHTLKEMVDTLVLPAAYSYQGALAANAAQAKAAGIKEIPQVERANEVGALAKQLKAKREALAKVIDKAESLHEELAPCATLLTSEGADAMAAVRAASDALELIIGDEFWPLPKYREMLFPV